MAYGIWEYDYLFYLFIFKVASHCALCADKISAKEKQHKERERGRKEEEAGDRGNSGDSGRGTVR